MDTLQQWDAIDLSTSESRKNCLETLLCQKVQTNEDIVPTITALLFLRSQLIEHEQRKLKIQQEREKSVFDSLQRVIITTFATLGMIAFFAGAFKVPQSCSSVSNNPPSIERH